MNLHVHGNRQIGVTIQLLVLRNVLAEPLCRYIWRRSNRNLAES